MCPTRTSRPRTRSIRSPPERRRQRDQCGDIFGFVSVDERFEQLVVFTQQIGLAREHVDEITIGAPLELRDDLPAEPDPAVMQLVVHGIVHGRESETRAQLMGFAATETEQRTAQESTRRGHSRQARCARAPQHLEEHRLRLVVARVRDEDRSRADLDADPLQCGVARVARPGFEVRPGTDVDVLHPGLRPETGGGRDHGGRVVAGTSAQTMVDVHRVHVETVLARQCEQREGVGAPAAADDHGRARREVVERREIHTRAASTRRSQRRGSLSSGTVGRLSGASHTASNARRPAMS